MIGKVDTRVASEFDTTLLQLRFIIWATWIRGFDVHIVTCVDYGEEKIIRKLITARRCAKQWQFLPVPVGNEWRSQLRYFCFSPCLDCLDQLALVKHDINLRTRLTILILTVDGLGYSENLKELFVKKSISKGLLKN